ncbi:hypothetical protein EDD15DRAFT_1095186 [Pisolithus albus]|nr:hypothetical protein EDD15DRAFT_1095186 [Pisolithus albus]
MHVRGSVCHLAIGKSRCARLVSGPSTWGTIARMSRLTEFPPSHPPISSDGISEARHRRIKPGDFIKLLRIFFFSSQCSRRCPQAQLCIIVLLESRLAPMPDSESDDEFPNDFDGIDFSAVPELQPQHLQLPQAGPSTTTISSQVDLTGTPTSDQGTGVSVNISDPRGTSSSLDSFDELDVDPYLLAACDEIEHRALWGHHTNTVPGPLANVSPPGSFGKGKKRSFTDCDFHSQPVAKPSVVATLNAPESYSGEKLQTILGGYEDEITCPICCDILVAAFMCNPCGHTTCGDCGYGWIARNRYSPTCAVCRSELIKSKASPPKLCH